MDKIDKFLEKIGVELLPYQKEFLKHFINNENVYVLYSPSYGRYYLHLLYLIHILFEKDKNI